MSVYGILLGLLAVQLAYSQGEDVYVTIPNGQIKGQQLSTYNRTYYAFMEIPYAKPPIGELRFKAPEPVENWDGILDATVNEHICYQMGNSVTEFKETEDCLYVNVYTPVEPGFNGTLPVMFHIFGGGFLIGHPDFKNNGPQYLIDEGVIVVTVNYRLGPFGFLSTGDTVVPGNMGLKDQALGLKWVHDNIEYFGGDPDKVTIFGGSAGAASVTFQMLSKQSEGHFRSVIAQSGSALCPWAFQRNAKDIAYNVATYLDPTFDKNASSEELLTFLQSKTVKDIINFTNSFPWAIGRDQSVQGFQFAPVVEPDHKGAFLTQRMYDAVASGGVSPVPLIIGTTSEEQISRAKNLEDFTDQLKLYDKDPAALVNDNMHIINKETKTVVGKAIRSIYTDGLLQDDIAAGIHYFTDTSFSRPLIHYAKLHSQFNDVYFYQFSYHGDLVTNNVTVEGCGRVAHGEDKAYLWRNDDNKDIEEWGTEGDILTTKRYVKLLTNFAKTLNPTPEESELFQNVIWPKVTEDNFQYLDIDADLTVKTNPKGNAYTKWVELYEKMAAKPYDTF